MGTIIDLILDLLLPYKVMGEYYAGKSVSITGIGQDGTVCGHEEPYGKMVYWVERFFTLKNAQRFIERGHSTECIFAGGGYFKLLRTENKGKTFVVWDNGLD